MTLEALRTLGIATSAALIAGALALSFTAPAPQAQAQPARAEPVRAAPVAFLVRFRGNGPIARAQRTAQAGDIPEAQRVIQAQLRLQREFNGLCFDRFTLGAAEVVLRTCTAIVASERAAVQQSWLTRLQAMAGVAYVDPNAVANGAG